MEAGDPNAPAGWYPDAERGAGLRYWDGAVWTDQRVFDLRPKSLKATGVWAVATLAACMVASLVFGLISLDYGSAVQEQLDTGGLSIEEADDAEVALGVGTLIYYAGYLAAAIAFLIWFHRAYTNTRGLTRGGLRYGTHQAVWPWFVPIFSLWRPKQVANDIWRAGDPAARYNRDWHAVPVASLVHWWWAAWILMNVVSGVGNGLLSTEAVLSNDVLNPAQPDSELEQEHAAAIALAVSALFQIGAGAVAILFVRGASKRQEEIIQADAREAAAAAGAGPGPGSPSTGP